jgi:acyl dehydratase
MNPLHLDAGYAAHSMFGKRIAPGMLVAGLISAVLAPSFPGVRLAAVAAAGKMPELCQVAVRSEMT